MPAVCKNQDLPDKEIIPRAEEAPGSLKWLEGHFFSAQLVW
jgi:hypothetical protein